MNPKLCKCKNAGVVFKKYYFRNRKVAYKGTCTTCGLLRNWYDGKNYKLIVTGNNLKCESTREKERR